ncbi:MAG: alpha/beta fold hydrolase [Leptonema sp. (in: bacteria)]
MNRYKIVTDFFNIEPRTKEEISIPKLIIISENDPLIPKFLREEFTKAYPEAQVFSFPKEGHFPYVVSPQKYNQIVSEFIKKN